ncbi:hypothetical protein GCM10009128_20650 [Psychrosphaera haliotis]|uniref:Ppx/GppA family phosphatase n=1 Tax=Psychrosphaera haliotis TaxID=555083 RepID=UPI0031E00217
MTNSQPGSGDLAFSDTTKIAVLDIGSNSFHFVVGEMSKQSVKILYKLKQKVRLADGLSDDMVLSNAAIERGVEALEKINQRVKTYKPDFVKVVGTYTLRNATNIADFERAAKSVFSYPIQILSGEEEAKLIFNGVARSHTLDKSTLIIDIGGGSTEFVIGQNKQSDLAASLDMGCVSYSQRYFPQNIMTNDAFDKAINAAKNNLKTIEDSFVNKGWEVCLGTSGSVESLVSVIAQDTGQQLSKQAITLEDLYKLKRLCINAGNSEALSIGEINECRKHVFAAGLSIIIAAFEVLNIQSLKVVTSALREGVMYEVFDAM